MRSRSMCRCFATILLWNLALALAVAQNGGQAMAGAAAPGRGTTRQAALAAFDNADVPLNLDSSSIAIDSSIDRREKAHVPEGPEVVTQEAPAARDGDLVPQSQPEKDPPRSPATDPTSWSPSPVAPPVQQSHSVTADHGSPWPQILNAAPVQATTSDTVDSKPLVLTKPFSRNTSRWRQREEAKRHRLQQSPPSTQRQCNRPRGESARCRANPDQAQRLSSNVVAQPVPKQQRQAGH
jgi:hypothetical protein